MTVKVPTFEDYINHCGLHYKELWKSIDNNWVCPACGRSKFQIMRWTTRFPNKPNKSEGWVATLHRHHDHSGSQKFCRFTETIICAQCNAADGVAKRKLGLPHNFSFSPEEMRYFIRATPHAKHEIDYEMAQRIHNSLS